MSHRDDIARVKATLARRLSSVATRYGFVMTAEITSGGSYSPGTPVGNPTLWRSLDGARGRRKPPAGYVGGFARANWAVGLNQITGIRAGRPGAPALGAQEAQVAGMVQTYQLGDTIYITNDAPYIRRLEFGWSQQAPDGMLRPAVDASDDVLSEIVDYVRDHDR